LSPDTIIPDFWDPQSLNPFSYVKNNPVSYTDPSGHKECGPYCEDDWINWQIDFGSAYLGEDWGTWDLPPIENVFALEIDFVPILGDLKGFLEVFTGRDLISGERLGAWRWLGLLCLSELRAARYADEFLPLSVPIGKFLRNGQVVEVGRWMRETETMDDLARAYQRFVTGAEYGYVFRRNGYNFDGIRMTRAGEPVLLDAKAGYDFYSKVGDPSRPFIEKKVLSVARKQMKAAGDLPIEWHVMDKVAEQELTKLFFREGITIDVVWTAWSP
jgi:hypothetical protein